MEIGVATRVVLGVYMSGKSLSDSRLGMLEQYLPDGRSRASPVEAALADQYAVMVEGDPLANSIPCKMRDASHSGGYTPKEVNE